MKLTYPQALVAIQDWHVFSHNSSQKAMYVYYSQVVDNV